MKKLLFTLLIGFAFLNFATVTEQQPDIIFYNNEELMLDVGWGHPSPLQAYYQQNDIPYPFKMLHTANYRGHIATWEITDDKFFITKIDVKKEEYAPKKFDVKSKDPSFSEGNKVFADWFTGVLVCQKRKKRKYWKIEYTVYIYVKNGVVEKSETFTDKDFEEIQNITEKDTTNLALMNKYSILYLNQSYIGYYFRLNDKESVEIDGKAGFLKGKKGYSIVLEKYKNSHFDWPYNWENYQLNGAPNGSWKVQDGKLYLTQLSLNQGTGFDGPEKLLIPLSEIFPEKPKSDSKVLANWTNGIYLAVFGEEVADEIIPQMTRFKEKEYTLMRIENGIILEKRTISNDFDFKNVPEDTEEVLKKLITDFKNQRK